MNKWSEETLKLIESSDYLDQLQSIYPHEEGVREINQRIINNIKRAYNESNSSKLLNLLLDLEKFPYKDSYVGFLRKDRSAIERNPQTVQRICNTLQSMGLNEVIKGIEQPKEANQRRGNQFANWIKNEFIAYR